MEFKEIGDDDSQQEFIQKLDEIYEISESNEKMIFKKGSHTSELTMKENPETWILKSTDNTLIKKFKDYVKSQKNRLTESDIENSIIKYPLENFSNNDYGNFKLNKYGFLETNKIFKKSGIESVLINENIKSFYKKVTLAINPGYETRNLESKFVPNNPFLKKTYSFNLIKKISSEEVEEIKFESDLIGEYYKNRNLIILNSNILYDFDLKNLEFLKKYKFIRQNTDKIALIYLTEKFFKGFKKSKKHLSSTITSNKSEIVSLSENIVYLNKKIIEDSVKLTAVDKLIKSGEVGFAEEIKSVKRLKFVKGIKPETNGIRITLKESFVNIRNFERNKSFGKRKVYLGEISVSILPDSVNITGIKTIKCKQVGGSCCHPHVDSSGFPCFDEGEFRKDLYRLIAEVKLTSVIQLIRLWSKECVNGQTYITGHEFYDDRLRRGFPVFDGSERVKLNDPVRLKSGEQVKLTKTDEYNKNIKKFKDVIV